MIGFLSSSGDPQVKVKHDEIYFVSVPDGTPLDDIKMLIAPKSKLFADKLNLDKVFLHFGKETIIYEFKV